MSMQSPRRIAATIGVVALLLAATAGPALAKPNYSKDQLREAQETLNKRFAKAKAPTAIAYWGEDTDDKRIDVAVVASDREAMKIAKRTIADVPEARITVVSERPQLLWRLLGGSRISSPEARCSLGVNALDSSGRRHILTAGHCTEFGGTWRGTGGTIGPVVKTSFPGDDFGAIRVSSKSAVRSARIDRYNGGGFVTINGPGTVRAGRAVCRSGATTGWRCGTVLAVNQTVNYGGGVVVGGLTQTTACAEPGDSGGPFVTNPGSGSRVAALGLLSGGTGDCRTGGTTFYQQLPEALRKYEMTLVTG
jgi:streptogrisin C